MNVVQQLNVMIHKIYNVYHLTIHLFAIVIQLVGGMVLFAVRIFYFIDSCQSLTVVFIISIAPLGSFNSTCNSTSQCQPNVGLYCSTSNNNGKCICQTGYFWNGTYCGMNINIILYQVILFTLIL